MTAKCELCGEPMPPGEEVFHYHGFSGPCPKPPLEKPPPRFKVTARCEAGHEQVMTMGGVTREWMELYVGLLDGTSPAYLSRPADDDKSVIGKCGICGKRFKATFEEVTG